MLEEKCTRSTPIRRGLLPIFLLVVGFLLAFSYKTFQSNDKAFLLTTWNEDRYRDRLLEEREETHELYEQLNERLAKVKALERQFDEAAERALVLKLNQLRLLAGDVEAIGEGVTVVLKDAQYDPVKQNPNDYIVHESHVLKMVNELKIAGAEGIAVNGQRLHARSSIKCTGPVITIDGQTYPAPFVVEAIGPAETLMQALELTGGVVDQLSSDQIVVDVQREKELTLPSLRSIEAGEA